jgi:hypothetical protein
MRTTLDIDDDVLDAAREFAAREKSTAGRMISEWARRGIHARDRVPASPHRKRVVNGFEILPAGGRVVTDELVRQLMDDTESR